MYNAQRPTTITEAIRLYEFAREIKPSQMIIFLAGKSDLVTNEQQNEASDVFYKSSQISRDVLVRYVTCSAKTGQNIQQVFAIGLEKNLQQIERENFSSLKDPSFSNGPEESENGKTMLNREEKISSRSFICIKND